MLEAERSFSSTPPALASGLAVANAGGLNVVARPDVAALAAPTVLEERLIMRASPLLVPFLAGCLLAACAPPEATLDGEVGKLIERSARTHRVPVEIMVAIAHVEGGLKLAPFREVDEDELVPIAGVLELRHGRLNTLALGARLAGRSELELQQDRALGTEAGARVLAHLAAENGVFTQDLAAWAPVVEQLSGHGAERARADYRARVYAVLRDGGVLRARGGEVIRLPPQEGIPLELTLAPPPLAAQGTPDYAGALWFETPQTDKWSSGRGGNPVSMIAIHDTEGGWDASVATLQFDPNKSCHYIIDADGSRVGQFVSEADTAWHVGNFWYNQRMVGIEHVGKAADDDYQTPMYETSATLVRDIAKRHALGPNGDGSALDRSVIVGHQEVPDGTMIPADSPPCAESPGTCLASPNYGGASNHRDPGIYWEWCQYMEIIGNGASCKCNDAYTHFNCTHDMSARVRCADGMTVEISHCANQSCIIQPIGVDDICGEEESSSSSSSGAMGGSGGSSGGGGGSAGVGGAPGGSGSTSAGDPSDATESKGSGCSACAIASGADGDLAWAAGVVALASAGVRRRRRR